MDYTLVLPHRYECKQILLQLYRPPCYPNVCCHPHRHSGDHSFQLHFRSSMLSATIHAKAAVPAALMVDRRQSTPPAFFIIFASQHLGLAWAYSAAKRHIKA